MFINLHSHVLAKLAAREVPWTQVARETGMSYETLKKIASGRTSNPGVQHVQKLADYFFARLPVAQVHPQRPAQVAIDAVASAQAAIKHVEAEAVAVIRGEAGQTASEIKRVANELLHKDEPVWDGATERRHDEAQWDSKTERHKIEAPIDRCVSPASVLRAGFLRAQANKQNPKGV